MGSVYKRGRTWWLKYKDATGEWTPEATKALTKAEAKGRPPRDRAARRATAARARAAVGEPEGWTVADLMQWWLETYSRHSPSHERNVGTVRRHILESGSRRSRSSMSGPGELPMCARVAGSPRVRVTDERFGQK